MYGFDERVAKMTTETKVKEYPILFTGEMVRAILDGRKTQTRRVVKSQPNGSIDHCYRCPDGRFNWCFASGVGAGDPWPCPYGVPGNNLWVREGHGFCPKTYKPGGVIYRSDGEDDHVMTYEWRPSIHMFRKDSRITLEVTEVRVERVQKIRADSSPFGHDDVGEEGCPLRRGCFHYDDRAMTWFRELWDSINAKRGFSWESNPWVWIVSFKKIKP